MLRLLNELTKAEVELIKKLNSVTGTMDEKHLQLKSIGVYDGFAQIYRDYAESNELEATKRAIFFFWYQASEPPMFSGLNDLPREVSEKVFEKLEMLAKSEEIDSELVWMLPFYYEISNWLFDDVYTSSSQLTKALIDTNHKWYKLIKREDFENRGIMGAYWLSMDPRQAQVYEDEIMQRS